MSELRKSHPFLLVVAAFLAAWTLFYSLPGLLGTWHLRAADQLFRLRHRWHGNLRMDPALVHLDIDDASIRALGPSAEAASRYEMIMQRLSSSGVAATAFDYVFLAAPTGMIAAARENGRVYAGVATGAGDAWIPESQVWHPMVTERGRAPSPQGVAFATCRPFAEAARGLGHITCFPDDDGIYRRIPLLVPLESGFLPSLSLKVVCDYLGVTPDRLLLDPGRSLVLRGAKFPDGRRKDIAIPLDESGRMIINFAGYEASTFPHYSLATFIQAAQDPVKSEQLRDELEGCIVVVADISTARDVGPVPMERVFHMPGLHTNAMNTILTARFVREPRLPLAVALDLVIALALAYVAVRIRSGRGMILASLAVLAAFVMAHVGLFVLGDTLTNGVRTTLGILFAIAAVAAQKYLHEETERAFLRARLENYFAPAVLNKILASPALLDVRERKTITILFSDICGFTPWSATRSPEEIHATLNEYFAAMAAIVFRHEGTVDKYIGDGLMAFFGDPVEHPDHALRAVRAAQDMVREAAALRSRWNVQGGLDLKIRIGINSGEAVVGNMGSERRVNYTAVGAHVNLAQRLEANARPGGILVSRAVYDRTEGRVAMKPAGTIRVKGFDAEVEVLEVEPGA